MMSKKSLGKFAITLSLAWIGWGVALSDSTYAAGGKDSDLESKIPGLGQVEEGGTPACEALNSSTEKGSVNDLPGGSNEDEPAKKNEGRSATKYGTSTSHKAN